MTNILEEYIIPFEQPMIINTQKINGRKKDYILNAANWKKITDVVQRGEMLNVLIRPDSESFIEQGYGTTAIALSVNFDYQEHFKDLPKTNIR